MSINTTLTHSVTPSQLLRLLDHYTSRKNSTGEEKPMLAPFIWGGPGIGKTDLVRTLAKARGSRIVALHLPQFDPTDIRGLPIRGDDDTVRWVASSYLPQQKRIHVGTATGIDVVLKWEYAVDLAVYVYDRDGNEIARYSDPVLSNIGDVSVSVKHIGTGEWHVTTTLPYDAHEVVIADKAIVFLDELSAAEPATQNAALQLVLDRRVGEYEIPPGVPVIAAGNRESDGAFVQTLSHPLCNRFAHITLVPDVDDFIEWGMYNSVRPEILGYVKAYPDGLYNYNPDALTNGNYGFATPRTLKFLSDQYEPLSVFEEMSGGTGDRAERLRMASFAGIIGQTEAARFIGYLQIMHDLPSAAEVVAGTADRISNVERSKTFGLLFSLIQNLKQYHQKHYDDTLSVEQQSSKWTVARDNIIDYITNNFERESGAWAGTVIFNQLGLTYKSLRSDAMMRFSQKYVNVTTRMGRAR